MTCEQLIAAYLATLKDGFACAVQPNGRLAVVTPYLYPDHDRIEVFVRDHGDKVVVSDLGETLRHLDTQGMDVCGNANMLYAAERIAGGVGVAVTEGALRKSGPSGEVGGLVFDVVAACAAVSSLIYGNRSYEPASFDEEVARFLENHGILLEPGGEVIGQSGAKYYPSFRHLTPAGETLIKTISPRTNAGVRQEVTKAFRMWFDLGVSIPQDHKVNVLNDDALKFPEHELNLLRRVSDVYRWTERPALATALGGTLA